MSMSVADIIRKLENIDLSQYPYSEVKELLQDGIRGIDFALYKLEAGNAIYRARLNENDEHFYSKCQLTYKPMQFNEKYQRASTPNMTMFYGAILPPEFENGELREIRAVPLIEISSWFRNKNIRGMKKITYSKWNVKNDLHLVAVIQNKRFIDRNSFTRMLSKRYTEQLDRNPDKKEKSLLFNDFLANQFAKPIDENKDYEYLISSIFSELIVSLGVDGILYPSVKLDGDGINIAVTPEVADKKLKLNVVLECTAYKNKDKTVIDNDYQTIILKDQVHFILEKMINYHAGKEECLRQLGLKSDDELFNF